MKILHSVFSPQLQSSLLEAGVDIKNDIKNNFDVSIHTEYNPIYRGPNQSRDLSLLIELMQNVTEHYEIVRHTLKVLFIFGKKIRVKIYKKENNDFEQTNEFLVGSYLETEELKESLIEMFLEGVEIAIEYSKEM